MGGAVGPVLAGIVLYKSASSASPSAGKLVSMLMGGVGSATVAAAQGGSNMRDVAAWTAATGISSSPMLGETLRALKTPGGRRLSKIKSLPLFLATVSAPAFTHWARRFISGAKAGAKSVRRVPV